MYGPYGGGGGSPFKVDFPNGNVLLYLFGRAGGRIDQIGFASGEQPPELPSTIIRSDEYGGTDGGPFDDLNSVGTPAFGKISLISVRSGDYIDQIKVKYADGPEFAHGGTAAGEEQFRINDGEWLTEIQGRAGQYVNQLQFVLSSGRVSRIFGRADGKQFRLARKNFVIKAIFGRSGKYVDQIGVYFEKAKPLAVDIISMKFDQNKLAIQTLPPLALMTTDLKNNTVVSQTVSQKVSITKEDSTTTTISETTEASVKMKVEVDAGVVSSGVEVELRQGVTYETGKSQTFSETQEFNFDANVPANSTIRATCIASQASYEVPWTATANVTYEDQSKPVQMTLHGVLKGVRTMNLRAQYDPVN